jgi:hypothetical protein
LNAEYANHVSITNNVFYKGINFLIQALSTSNWKIENNLLIGALLRPNAPRVEETNVWDPVALIHMWTKYLPSV